MPDKKVNYGIMAHGAPNTMEATDLGAFGRESEVGQKISRETREQSRTEQFAGASPSMEHGFSILSPNCSGAPKR